MKRYGNLYDKIIDMENIKLAHKNARKGKTYYKEVKMVDSDINHYCEEIHKILKNKTFRSSKYEMFIKKDKGKEREIYKLPYYPDRIIQHAILQITEPIWKASLINDTYQSIKGRGVHKCLNKIKRAVMVEKRPYCLQVDVKKFYPSIKNSILKKAIRKKIKCKDTLWLLDTIIDGHKGVPIGNYISQYFGNLVLSDIDHKMKEVFKCKWYFRYCDDIIILSENKRALHKARKVIERLLREIELKIKENWQIYKITNKRPVDCLGFKVSSNKVAVRDDIINNLKKADRKEQLSGYRGWLKHTTNQYGLYLKHYKRIQE